MLTYQYVPGAIFNTCMLYGFVEHEEVQRVQ
jgi:hypothetical protein